MAGALQGNRCLCLPRFILPLQRDSVIKGQSQPFCTALPGVWEPLAYLQVAASPWAHPPTTDKVGIGQANPPIIPRTYVCGCISPGLSFLSGLTHYYRAGPACTPYSGPRVNHMGADSCNSWAYPPTTVKLWMGRANPLTLPRAQKLPTQLQVATSHYGHPPPMDKAHRDVSFPLVFFCRQLQPREQVKPTANSLLFQEGLAVCALLSSCSQLGFWSPCPSKSCPGNDLTQTNDAPQNYQHDILVDLASTCSEP